MFRMRYRAVIAVALVGIGAASLADGEEMPVVLAPGPGLDAMANCAACHSLDYIRINAPFMTRKAWEAEVAKMITVFGAPIDPADAKTIADYLVRNYGKPD
jgi:sulfite dehydrogenase (cytochrome) subunit B